MELLRRTKPKARKDHRCDYCGGVISKGETYEFQTNVYDGQIYNWKSHCRCQEIASVLGMFEEAEEGVNDDYFCETISAEYANLTRDIEDQIEYPKLLERLAFVCDHHLGKGGKDGH